MKKCNFSISLLPLFHALLSHPVVLLVYLSLIFFFEKLNQHIDVFHLKQMYNNLQIVELKWIEEKMMMMMMMMMKKKKKNQEEVADQKKYKQDRDKYHEGD